jgi:hypothetical protein
MEEFYLYIVREEVDDLFIKDIVPIIAVLEMQGPNRLNIIEASHLLS